MGRLLVVVAAAVGGLAFWRRKSLKDDAGRVAEAAKGATARVTSGSTRKSLLVELGEAVYTDRVDPDADLATEIDRLVIDLRDLELPEGAEPVESELVAADASAPGD